MKSLLKQVTIASKYDENPDHMATNEPETRENSSIDAFAKLNALASEWRFDPISATLQTFKVQAPKKSLKVSATKSI